MATLWRYRVDEAYFLSDENCILSRAFLYWLDLIKIKGRIPREFNNTHLWVSSPEKNI